MPLMRLSVIALTCLVQSATQAQSPLAPAQRLVWDDTFDGDSLDYSKWEIEQNAFGGGNQELQIYTDRPQNVRVDQGNRSP